MKKILLACTALVLTVSPVMAEDNGNHYGHDKGGFMQKIDTDGDGKISKSEFVNSHEERFSKMDTNGDGYLEREEMKAAKQKMREKFKGKRGEFKGKGKFGGGAPDVEDDAE